MDIAKYIGLFLLKNNFVYLHGLGNLELKKKPASYDGEALRAPEYDAVLTPGGSIDDTLANYIATHEQTSISKAANALRDFSAATRVELAAGKNVEIPGIGAFTEQNGIVRFIANPHLQHVPPAVPILRLSKRLEEAPDFRRDSVDRHQTDDNASGIAWGKIAIMAIVLAAVIAAVVFGIRYFNSNSSETVAADSANTTPAAVLQPETPAFEDTTAIFRPADTASTVGQQVAPATAAPANGAGYTVLLQTYPQRANAERRVARLKGYGHNVDMRVVDSATFQVTMFMPGPVADTARMLDSLARNFNPKGVRIIR